MSDEGDIDIDEMLQNLTLHGQNPEEELLDLPPEMIPPEEMSEEESDEAIEELTNKQSSSRFDDLFDEEEEEFLTEKEKADKEMKKIQTGVDLSSDEKYTLWRNLKEALKDNTLSLEDWTNTRIR